MIKKISSAIILLFCLNCTNTDTNTVLDKNIEVIEICPKKVHEYVNLSSFADSITYIKLNHNSDELIGDAYRIIIRDKYIYLIDRILRQIILFDKNGSFVTKLSKYGEGPECYSFLGPVFVDPAEMFITIIDMRANKLMKYSNITFDLAEKDTFPDINFNTCVKTKNDIYYIVTQQFDNLINGKMTNSEFVIYTKDKFINKQFDKRIKTNNNYYSPVTETVLIGDNDKYYYSSMFSNIIYSIDSTNLSPLYRLDFGDYNLREDMAMLPLDKQIEYINQMKDIAAFPVMTLNNENYLILSYYFKENSKQNMFRQKDLHQFIVTKKDGKTFHARQIKNDISDFPKYVSFDSYFSCTHDIFYDGHFVEVIIPSKYLDSIGEEFVEIEGLGIITPDSDPIIVLMKAK